MSMRAQSLQSCPTLCNTVARQTPLSMGMIMKKIWMIFLLKVIKAGTYFYTHMNGFKFWWKSNELCIIIVDLSIPVSNLFILELSADLEVSV